MKPLNVCNENMNENGKAKNCDNKATKCAHVSTSDQRKDLDK